MPDRDGQGPRGMGSLSGKCQGNCIVKINTPEEELAYLLNRQQVLKEELEATQKRLARVQHDSLPVLKSPDK